MGFNFGEASFAATDEAGRKTSCARRAAVEERKSLRFIHTLITFEYISNSLSCRARHWSLDHAPGLDIHHLGNGQ
jgi:hypothetical protein